MTNALLLALAVLLWIQAFALAGCSLHDSATTLSRWAPYECASVDMNGRCPEDYTR